MFQDLDETLKQLLEAPGAPDKLRDADVSFETPRGTYSPANAVNLFLHELHEDRELRDPVPIIELTADGQYSRRAAPLRVQCNYAVTAWVSGSTAESSQVQLEHQLLGEALRWLSRFPTIPSAYLRGELANPAFPLPTLVAQPDAERYNGQFWSALGTAPRPAFSLQVVIAMDVAPPVLAGPPVRTVRTDFRIPPEPDGDTAWQVGGHVQVGSEPVAQAWLRVQETGATAQSDAVGRYVLGGLAAGAYTIEIFAVGQQPKTHRLLVPGRPEDYDIILDPL